MNDLTMQPNGIEVADYEFEHGPEVHAGDGSDISDPGHVRNWLESFDSANIFEGLDAFDFGDGFSDAQVDFLGADEAVDEPRPFAQELALTALDNLPNLGSQRRTVKEESLRRLDEEDFALGISRLTGEGEAGPLLQG